MLTPMRAFRLALPLLVLGVGFLAGCGGTAVGDALNEVQISMGSDNTFRPASISVNAGQIVRWTNSTTAPHTVTGDAAGSPNSDLTFRDGIPPLQTYTWRVPTTALPGARITYHCRFHGTPGSGGRPGTGMAGVLVVR